MPIIDQFTSTDKDIQARLIAMGARPASTDIETQTMAASKLSPGVLVRGGITGQTPGGQGLAQVDREFQAYTSPGASPQVVTSPSGSQVVSPVQATNVNYGVDAQGRSLAPKKEPTLGEIYGGGSDLDAAYAAREARIREAQQPYDEEAIRQQTMNRFQNEIDALNQFYAQKKAQALESLRPAAESRLGQSAAIQARRGLMGSSFGAAQTSGIIAGNEAIARREAELIDAERAAQIASIRGKAQSQADQEIKEKKEARDRSYQDLVTFLEGKKERAMKNAGEAITSYAALGQEPTDEQYEELRKLFGVDLKTLKAQYKTLESAKKAEIAKNATKPIEVDGSLVDPVTGKVIYTSPGKTSDDWQFIPASKYQKSGYFNKKTGEFKPGIQGQSPVERGGAEDSRAFPISPTSILTKEIPKQSFEDYLAKEEAKAGLSFSPSKRAEMKVAFEKLNLVPETNAQDSNLSKYSFLTQQVIRGELPAQEILSGGTAGERRRYENELKRAESEGLLRKAPSEYQLKTITSINDSVAKAPIYTRTASMRNYADNVLAALGQETGVSDIAAINQFQKVIDEGAVTRDQDVKLLQNSQSLANSLRTQIKRLERGDQLSPELRQQMSSAITAIYDAQVKAVEKDPYIKSKIKEVQSKNIDPKDTILGELSSFAPATSSGSATDILNKYGIK